MRFAGLSKEPIYRWFDYRDGFRAQLKYVTHEELASAIRRFKIGAERGENLQGYKRFIAEKWFVGFEGAELPDGSAIEDTPDNRVLLMSNLSLWNWLNDCFLDAASWAEEGNGDSAPAS